MRRSSNIKTTDIKRIAKALCAVRLDIACVEIDPASGKIAFMTRSSSGTEKITDLDTWLAKDARQT
jgi:hypothetical protein